MVDCYFGLRDQISSERRETPPSIQIEKPVRDSLMLILQGLREDYGRMEEKLSGSLSEFEKKLSEMDTKITALVNKRST